MADIADLVGELEGDPVGPDLSYDPDRELIERAFSVSGEGTRAEDTVWRDVIRRILDQAGRTRDLWLAVYLARAGAMAGDLGVAADGAQLLAGLLETHWADVHPRLDEVGFIGRRGACDSLARHAEFILPLKRVPLIAHPRLGSFSALDLERFEQEGDSAAGYGMFRAAIEQTDDDAITATAETLDRVRDGLRRADAVLMANAGDDTGTDFAPAYQALAAMRAALGHYVAAAPSDAETDPGAEAVTGAGPAESAATGSVPGRLDSREDVLRALDAIGDYYRRREPGSAVPFALRRAREWVPMSFIDVLADIAPASMEDARRVLLSRSMIEQADA